MPTNNNWYTESRNNFAYYGPNGTTYGRPPSPRAEATRPATRSIRKPKTEPMATVKFKKQTLREIGVGNFTARWQGIMSPITNHLIAISNLISTVLYEYHTDSEWTKDPRYKIWFEKWADVTENVLWTWAERRRTTPLFGEATQRHEGERSPYFRTLPFPSSHVPLNLISEDFIAMFRSIGKFDIDFYKSTRSGRHDRHIYTLNSPIEGKSSKIRIKPDELIAFYPEMAATFANTFLYRLIEIKQDNGKIRKITIINQKLPAHIRKLYDEMSKQNVFKNVYDSLLGPNGIDNTSSAKILASATGFIKGKSYLNHVKAHRFQEAVLTCDINKFYNSLNLNNILKNNFIPKIFKKFRLTTTSYLMNGAGYTIMPEEEFFAADAIALFDFYEKLFTDFLYSALSFHTFNGMLPTGTYSAPAISNLLMMLIDIDLYDFADKNRFKYTRYVDDIAISSKLGSNKSNKKKEQGYLISVDTAKEVEKILNPWGLYLKYDKTHIYGAKDNKSIANLNIIKGQEYPSIGSKYKIKLKELVNGKSFKDLDDQIKGMLSWVRTVNPHQYAFVIEDLKDIPVKLKATVLTKKQQKAHDELAAQLKEAQQARDIEIQKKKNDELKAKLKAKNGSKLSESDKFSEYVKNLTKSKAKQEKSFSYGTDRMIDDTTSSWATVSEARSNEPYTYVAAPTPHNIQIHNFMTPSNSMVYRSEYDMNTGIFTITGPSALRVQHAIDRTTHHGYSFIFEPCGQFTMTATGPVFTSDISTDGRPWYIIFSERNRLATAPPAPTIQLNPVPETAIDGTITAPVLPEMQQLDIDALVARVRGREQQREREQQLAMDQPVRAMREADYDNLINAAEAHNRNTAPDPNLMEMLLANQVR